MPQVTNEEFFGELRSLMQVAKTKGSVYLVQKRLVRPNESHSDSSPLPLVFRASNGAPKRTQRVSVSTVVEPSDLALFWQNYSEALKKGAVGLRKKDKKKLRK